MSVTAIIPCRKGSQRIVNKNIKPFANSSLIDIKINQLLKVNRIDNIVISTDDEVIFDLVNKYNNPKIQLHKRDAYFGSSKCTTDELITYFIENIEFDNLLWTHVTSPFVDEKIYDEAVKMFFSMDRAKYDSLISVEKIQEFLWSDNGEAVNYDRQKEGNWPRTQDINPLYLVNSAMFLASKEVMKKYNDRVGKKPFYFEMNKFESLDIDWPEEFELAEKVYSVLNHTK